jgi:hypothetical protein
MLVLDLQSEHKRVSAAVAAAKAATTTTYATLNPPNIIKTCLMTITHSCITLSEQIIE